MLPLVIGSCDLSVDSASPPVSGLLMLAGTSGLQRKGVKHTSSWCVLFCLFLFYVYGFLCLNGMCMYLMPAVFRGQKRVPDPLNLETWMFVSFHMGAGNQTWDHRKNNSQCS